MAGFDPKIKIKSAIEKHSVNDLSGTTITTLDFFKIQPTHIIECVPGATYDIDLNAFTRCEAFVKPAFADVKQENRFFFVPMRVIFKSWNDFITQNLTSVRDNAGSPSLYSPQVPYIYAESLLACFIHYTDLAVLVVDGDGDFTYDGQNYSFTYKGRVAYQVLVGLGYRLDVNIQVPTTSPWDGGEVFNRLSALPLLAYCKIYFDFYQPTNIINAHRTWFQGLISDRLGVSDTYAPLKVSEVHTLLTYISDLFYGHDYFTASFQEPYGNGQTVPTQQILQPSGLSDFTQQQVGSGTDSEPHLQSTLTSTGSSQGLAYLTQKGLDLLKGISDYVQRLVDSGFRPADRYKNRFGIDLSDAELDQASYLGKSIQVLNIADVMSTADTTGAGLGDYAGKGVFTQGKSDHIHLQTKEYGYLICITQIVPKIGYVQGRPRFMHHLNRFDFFSPEFDMAGNQAVYYDELYTGTLDGMYPGQRATQAFSYLPRYAEYKVGRDILGGDFSIGSRVAQLDSYHLFRLFGGSPYLIPGSSIDFTFLMADGVDYDRIFQSVDGSFDGFTSVLRFSIRCKFPGSKLFENYDFDGAREVSTLIGSSHM